MSALDGKITIERGLRPCIVHIPELSYKSWDNEKQKTKHVVKRKEETHKALFHCWNPVTGNAIIEYEDGTIHEVEPTQVRFVDNTMCEYAFPEAEENKDKSGNEWKPLKRVNHFCPKCGQGRMKIDEGIILTSNPPQYRYQCDECGYVECSSSWIEASVLDNYEGICVPGNGGLKE